MLRICALATSLVTLPAVAGAQLSGSIDLGSGLGQLSSSPWLRESRIAPALRFSHRAGWVQMEGAAVERGGAFALRRAGIEGAANSPAFGPFRIAVGGHWLSDKWQPTSPATSANVFGSVSAKLGASGVWAGTSRPRNAPLQVNLGAWRTFRSLVVSITNQTQSMRVGGPQLRTVWDSVWTDTTGWQFYNQRTITIGNSSRIERWSDLEARVDWSHGRLSVSAAMSGRRTRDTLRSRTWGRANAAFQFSPHIAVIAGGGTLPLASATGPSTSRFATFGVRLSPAAFMRPPLPAAIRPSATAFQAQLVEPGTYKVTVRVPSARTVEISGDFNQWTPVALRETMPSIWEATIALRPGTHRVNVRVDGDAWTAPPGLPATDDEFNGRVGILIIR